MTSSRALAWLTSNCVIALVAVFLTGCQVFRSCEPPDGPGQQRMCRSERGACVDRPFFSIDDLMIRPEKTLAGGTVTRRIVYTYCPRTVGETARGTMQTSIEYGERRVADSRRTNFPILPGQHTYDAEINIPKAAEPGIYMLETRFDGVKDASFKRYQVFKVVR